jgi:hypothetical protein
LEAVKQFLIESLTVAAHIHTQCVTSKLSSTLGLLVLYCTPDIWDTPIPEFTGTRAVIPEMFLR